MNQQNALLKSQTKDRVSQTLKNRVSLNELQEQGLIMSGNLLLQQQILSLQYAQKQDTINQNLRNRLNTNQLPSTMSITWTEPSNINTNYYSYIIVAGNNIYNVSSSQQPYEINYPNFQSGLTIYALV